MNEPIHIISLGAGVQSSTMALMAAAGEITPMPRCAIFADTQAEPASVYKWLDWLEAQLPFPVHRVSAGSLQEEALRVRTSAGGNKYTNSNVPVFLRVPQQAREGTQSRQCTGDFKIDPIHRKIREIAADEIRDFRRSKKAGPKPIVQWVGISMDEVMRMKPARPDYIENRWPLIETRTRRDGCLQWMKVQGFPTPPRSACVFCPYHSATEWQRLRVEEPSEFERAARFEEDYQSSLAQISRVRGRPFLHSSCVPLREIDFSRPAKSHPDLFTNECEGMCGV